MKVAEKYLKDYWIERLREIVLLAMDKRYAGMDDSTEELAYTAIKKHLGIVDEKTIINPGYL